MAGARGQDFSADEAIAFAPADQPQIIRVVSVPDAEQLARSCLLRDHIDLPTLAIAKHELKRIDMPLEQAPQGQTAGTNRSQHLAEGHA